MIGNQRWGRFEIHVKRNSHQAVHRVQGFLCQERRVMRKWNLAAGKGLPPRLSDGVAVLTVLLPMEEPDSITLPDQ